MGSQASGARAGNRSAMTDVGADGDDLSISALRFGQAISASTSAARRHTGDNNYADTIAFPEPTYTAAPRDNTAPDADARVPAPATPALRREPQSSVPTDDGAAAAKAACGYGYAHRARAAVSRFAATGASARGGVTGARGGVRRGWERSACAWERSACAAERSARDRQRSICARQRSASARQRSTCARCAFHARSAPFRVRAAA